jgi:hypothetical protein
MLQKEFFADLICRIENSMTPSRYQVMTKTGSAFGVGIHLSWEDFKGAIIN